MKAKTWLKIFCLEKREMINEVSRDKAPPYVDQEDLDEMDSWDEAACRRVIKRMKNPDFIDDGHYCPWCVYRKDRDGYVYCNYCGYGNRHGICDRLNSLYKQIKRKLPEKTIHESIKIEDLPIWDYSFE